MLKTLSTKGAAEEKRLGALKHKYIKTYIFQ